MGNDDNYGNYTDGWPGKCATNRGDDDVSPAKTVKSDFTYLCYIECKNEGHQCTFFDYNPYTEECNLHYDYSGGYFTKGYREPGYTCYRMQKW
jgi:hypothetical protein